MYYIQNMNILKWLVSIYNLIRMSNINIYYKILDKFEKKILELEKMIETKSQ